MQQPNPSQETTTEATKVDVTVTEPGSLATVSEAGNSDQWQQVRDQVISILSELPGILSNFFGEYQRPIITVGLIVTTLITIKVMLAVVDAINDIPLLAPTLELIGIGYSTWFIYRYLLRATSRKELVGEIGALTEQIVGKKS